MRAVIVDAGNTRVKCAAWADDSGLPRRDGRAASGLRAAPPLASLGSWDTPRDAAAEAAFARTFAARHRRWGHPPVVVVASVPRVADLLVATLADRAPVTVVDHRSPLPCRHVLAAPARTGPDRFCNVAAAAAAGLASAYVVDAGTATTVDVLRDGVFLGGVIAPGMAFALDQLGAAAARLAPVAFAPVPLEAGAGTEAAMAAGGFHAGVGGVEHLIAGLQARHGPAPVVVTGGLGAHLVRRGRLHDPHWTLRGAAVLAGLAAPRR